MGKDLTKIKKLVQPYSEAAKGFLPKLKVGARVRVNYLITEGNKKRIQVFEGIVISIKKPGNPDGTFTVRKVSFGVGIERTYPINSPNISKVEIVSYAKVRRSKLYYLRNAVSKKDSRLKTKFVTSGEDVKGVVDQSFFDGLSSAEEAQTENVDSN